VLKAREGWHPGYMTCGATGPKASSHRCVFCAPPIGRSRCWAKFDYVKSRIYRWGIRSRRKAENRVIPFCDHFWCAVVAGGAGRASRHAAPPERDRRAIPSRAIGRRSAISARTAPRSTTCAICSRSMSMKAAIAGRWSYLLPEIFRATAVRRPTIWCAARRRPTARAWLGASKRSDAGRFSSSCLHLLHRRDGKCAAQSGAVRLDPLSRTCRFMLTEEATSHVRRETGISRGRARTCEAMRPPSSAVPRCRQSPRARRGRSSDHPEEADPA